MGVLGDPVLLLGVAGAVIALVGSLTEKISRRPRVRLFCVTAVLGLLIFVVQQLISGVVSAQGKAQEEALGRTRDAILGEIRGTVNHTAGVVDDLSQRLAHASIGDLGDPLVVPDPAAREGVEILSMGKGPVSQWEAYAAWVRSSRTAGGPKRCLTFDLGGHRGFASWLSLAYLFTTPDTEAPIREVIRRGPRGPLWSQDFLERALVDWKGVDFVLFTDQGTRRPIAYARGREFATELLLRSRAGGAESLVAILNAPGTAPADALIHEFPSVRSWVIAGAEVPAVAKTMLERKWPECVADTSDGRFLVSLVNVIRAAA